MAKHNNRPIGDLAVTLSVSAPAFTQTDLTNPATQFINPANGHIYEFVNTGVNWTDAVSASALHTLAGSTGYLATITSATEQTFIFTHIPTDAPAGYWLGGSDSAVEGAWTWVTGPESGQQFWQGQADGAPVNGAFSNFDIGAALPQPNTNGGNLTEDYLVFNVNIQGYGLTPGYWGDANNSDLWGYIIEYDAPILPKTYTLTADASNISDRDGLGAFSYSWQKFVGGSWTDIAGATNAQYDLNSADVGQAIRSVISYTDGKGFNETVSSKSQIVGSDSADSIVGTSLDDVIQTLGGNDTAYGGHGDDTIIVGDSQSNDRLIGDAALLAKNEKGGDDVLVGGGAGSTTVLIGDAELMQRGSKAGDDTLISGHGNDLMWGDAVQKIGSVRTGEDTFVFAPSNGHDIIYDFEHGKDTLDFTALSDLGIHSAGDLTIHDTANGLLIEIDANNSVQLVGVHRITSHDFDFA